MNALPSKSAPVAAVYDRRRPVHANPAVIDRRYSPNPFPHRSPLRRLALPLALLLAFPLTASRAQSVRAGSSTNARTGSTASRSTTGGSSTGTGSASTGPRQYRSNTLLGDATIQIDPETRSLVIVTDEATHAELEKVIHNLDRPKPQVLIKVVFVEVTYNKGLDLGVEANYSYKLGTGQPATTTTGTGAVTTTPAAAAGAAALSQAIGSGTNFGLGALTNGTFVRLLTDDWAVTLRALATRGKVEVLSRPSIMARNNQEAVIVVGQEVPFITNSRTDAFGNLTNTIQYDNVGIILRVTPFITSENTVEMIVAPEISSLTDQTVPISSTASAPVIAKRSAETVVVTPNGATSVIGGLMETQRTETINKIPLLGDIPYLGVAFRRTVKNDTKRELLIFLTPTIVNTPAGLERATNDELNRADMIDSSFTPQDYEKYLSRQANIPATNPALPADGKTVRRATSVPGPRPRLKTTVTMREETTTNSTKLPARTTTRRATRTTTTTTAPTVPVPEPAPDSSILPTP